MGLWAWILAQGEGDGNRADVIDGQALKDFIDNKPIIPIPFLKSNLNNLSLSLMMTLLYGQLLRIKFGVLLGVAIVALCACHYQENTLHWPSSCSLTSMFKSLSPAGSAHVSVLSLPLSQIDTPFQPSQDTKPIFYLKTCHCSIISVFIPPSFDSKCSALLLPVSLDSGQSSCG